MGEGAMGEGAMGEGAMGEGAMGDATLCPGGEFPRGGETPYCCWGGDCTGGDNC